MKFFLRLILIVALSFFIEKYLPWWSLCLVCFVLGYTIFSTKTSAFFSGFFGIALLWAGYAYKLDQETSSILSAKMAQIFTMPHPLYLIAATGLVGGFTGAFATLSGHLLREIFKKKKKLYY